MRLLHHHIAKQVFVLWVLLCPLLSSAQYTDTVCGGHKGRLYGADTIAGQTYTWLVQGGTITAGQGGPTITVDWDTTPGNGMVKAIPALIGGCTGDTLSAAVLIQGKPKAGINGPAMACANDIISLKSANSSTGYTWSTGEGTSSILLQVATDTTIWLVTENGDCVSDTAAIKIKAVHKPIALINTSLPAEVYEGDPITFDFGGTDADKIYWNAGSDSQKLLPAQAYKPKLTGAGNYTVVQIAANKGLCFDTAYYDFVLETLGDVYIPSAFTPNADDINNIFEIDGNGFTYLELKIVDRWGAIMYETSGNNKLGWAGYYKDEPVPEGVYVYDITAKRGYHTRHYRGTITVFR